MKMKNASSAFYHFAIFPVFSTYLYICFLLNLNKSGIQVQMLFNKLLKLTILNIFNIL